MTCYLCEAQSFVRRKGSVRDVPDIGIQECCACGLVTLTSQDHIGETFYQRSGMHGETLPSIQSWLSETDADDERRFNMLRSALPGRRLLDFGAGACGFLLKAKTLAAEVVGVEPEARVIEAWKGKLNIAPDLGNVSAKFDIVTAFHVVEHLVDPRKVLADLGKMLSPRGRLIVEVPSSDDALLTLYDCSAFQKFTYWSQHLFLFNAATLERVTRQAGLRVTAIKHVQRYPLSNHLHWLSRGKPGGHQTWQFLNNPDLVNAYASALAAVGKTDTQVAYIEHEAS